MIGRATLAFALALTLSACFSSRGDRDCESEEEYQSARSAPPISVPAGLDHPDPSSRLNVPDGPQPAEPLSRNAACLQRPPNYFDKPVKTPAN